MSRYSDAVRQLMTSGKSQAEAERTVRREQPHLFVELAQEAAQRRAAQRSRGSRLALPSATNSTATATDKPDVNAMLARAVAGEYFTDSAIAQAVRPINRTAAWFRQEVAREREHIERESQERLAKRSATPVRQSSRGRAADLVSVQRHAQAGFDSLVCEAAKCEREYSDAEVLAAGFGVPAFRDRLANAVMQKVLTRSYSVGQVSCDCSGAGGVCVCK